MLLTMLKAKIHRARITEANLNYVGSITIDENLLVQSGLLEHEKVQIVDIDNGNRFETYIIKGKKNSGVMCVNGAAARLVNEGDRIIVMGYCHLTPEEASQHQPRVLFMNDNNVVCDITHQEKHGTCRLE